MPSLVEAGTGHAVGRRHCGGTHRRKTFGQAIWQIIVADVSMSLDNVLAVAGAARNYPYILVFGLVLSIALMGVAASFIANLLQKHRWIAYVGLAIILYVALDMCYRGAREVWPYAERIAALIRPISAGEAEALVPSPGRSAPSAIRRASAGGAQNLGLAVRSPWPTAAWPRPCDHSAWSGIRVAVGEKMLSSIAPSIGFDGGWHFALSQKFHNYETME